MEDVEWEITDLGKGSSVYLHVIFLIGHFLALFVKNVFFPFGKAKTIFLKKKWKMSLESLFPLVNFYGNSIYKAGHDTSLVSLLGYVVVDIQFWTAL